MGSDLVIKLNFEGIGSVFESEKSFCSYFTAEINKAMSNYNFKGNFITADNSLDMK